MKIPTYDTKPGSKAYSGLGERLMSAMGWSRCAMRERRRREHQSFSHHHSSFIHRGGGGGRLLLRALSQPVDELVFMSFTDDDERTRRDDAMMRSEDARDAFNRPTDGTMRDVRTTREQRGRTREE